MTLYRYTVLIIIAAIASSLLTEGISDITSQDPDAIKNAPRDFGLAMFASLLFFLIAFDRK